MTFLYNVQKIFLNNVQNILQTMCTKMKKKSKFYEILKIVTFCLDRYAVNSFAALKYSP